MCSSSDHVYCSSYCFSNFHTNCETRKERMLRVLPTILPPPYGAGDITDIILNYTIERIELHDH